jgi:hypothetical protein
MLEYTKYILFKNRLDNIMIISYFIIMKFRIVTAIIKLIKKYQLEINPCNNRAWIECVTTHNGQYVLWFNDADNSTHIVEINKSDIQNLDIMDILYKLIKK